MHPVTVTCKHKKKVCTQLSKIKYNIKLIEGTTKNAQILNIEWSEQKGEYEMGIQKFVQKVGTAAEV